MTAPSGSPPRHPAAAGLARSGLVHDPMVVGAVAVGLMLGTFALFSIPPDGPLLVAGFCGTALAYLVDRVWARSPEDRFNHPERVRWVARHREWLAVETGVLFAAGGTAVFFVNWPTRIGALLLGLVAVFHVVSWGEGRSPRAGLAKPVAIAGAWAVGGVVLPIVEATGSAGVGAVLLSTDRFLFILPNLLLSDWTDRGGDREVGLEPWAERWTGRQVRLAASLFLAGALGGGVVWGGLGSTPGLIAVDAVGPLLMLGAVWRLDFGRPTHAVAADLIVGWPIVTALAAWMML